MIKVALLGIVGVLLGIQFKSGRQEYAFYIGISVSVLIFLALCGYLEGMRDAVLVLGKLLEGSGAYLGILLKAVGITYLSEFCALLCRDAGYQSVASQVELFGKVTVLLAGMPVILSLIDTITGFMA